MVVYLISPPTVLGYVALKLYLWGSLSCSHIIGWTGTQLWI
uniref:Uncharacterized protein n=1 Tax=Anguilla anguilla TaxID=7936 RepID=A0A0E9SIE7_ANGAN